MMSSKKDPASSAGQSMLEFALILPLLLLITLGTIEFGRMLFIYSSVTNAGRTATRYGLAVGNSPNGVPYYIDCAGIINTARRAIIIDPGSPVIVNVTYDRDDGNGGTFQFAACPPTGGADAIVQGDRLVVQVQTQVRPIVSFLRINPLTMSTRNARTILKNIQFASGTVGGGGGGGTVACHILTLGVDPPDTGSVQAMEGNCDNGAGYLNGTMVDLTATAEPGFAFLDWTGPVVDSGSNPTTVLMDGNKTVIANFAEVCYSLTLNTNPGPPNPGGYITSGGGTPCSSDPSLYRHGSVVSFTAWDNDGYVFSNWEGAGTGNAGNRSRYVLMDGNKTATAVYEELPPGCFSLAVTANAGGNVFVPEPDCETGLGYKANETYTIYAVADPFHAFDYWTGSAYSTDWSMDVLMDGNKSFVAYFKSTAVDLSVTKAASPSPALPGNSLTYALQARNHSATTTATGVLLTDTLPSSVTFVSLTTNQGSCGRSGNEVTCDLGDMVPNSVVDIFIYVIAPNTAGIITNVARISSNEDDIAPGNNNFTLLTTISPMADLSITIQDSEDPIPAGDTLIYTLTVINHGPLAATDVVVSNTLPTLPLPGVVIFESATPSQGGCGESGGNVQCLLGNLANGASATITIRVIPSSAGYLQNHASVSSVTHDPNLDNNVAGEGTWVDTNPDEYIVLSKQCASPGETVIVYGFGWTTNASPNVITITWDPNGPDPSQVLGTVQKARWWSTTITIPVTASQGTHTIHAQRKNNEEDSKTIVVPCPAPNLVLSNPVLVSGTPVVAQSPVSFRVSVTNTGQLDAAGQFYLSLYLNPAPAPTPGASSHISSTFKIYSLGVNGLAVNENKTFTMTLNSGIAVTGTHAIYAVVDSDPGPFGVINETSEIDNISAALQVNVQPCVSNCDTGGDSNGTGGLAGEVFVSTVGGSPLPQPNAQVILYNSLGMAVRQLWSNEEGYYGFTNIAADTYHVTACANIEGVTLFAIVTGIVVNEGAFTFRDLLLAPGPCG
jgi:uncharacterized repeat protein (TIGR01451 family)